MKRGLAIGAALIGLLLSGCSGDDEEATGSPAARDGADAPSAPPPRRGQGALPPEFVQCMADQGFEVETPAEIHSAPPQVLQACFGSFHEGRGAP